VASADNYFNSQQYTMAKDNYEKALQIKPEASHPKVQLERANELLRKQEVENQKKLAIENKYNGLISQADASFNANDYDKAKSQYEQALKIKPNEEYPKERIRKILDIQRVLAANQQAANQTNNTVKPQGKAPAFVDMKVMKDSEKEKYLKSLLNKYPEGVTLEVYKEGNRTTNRYVVIRNNEVNEFREDHFNWGGHDYFINGKPITSQYFNSQVKAREGEKFQKFNM
jgi:tetratricopeptide (TPR) repeat protein